MPNTTQPVSDPGTAPATARDMEWLERTMEQRYAELDRRLDAMQAQVDQVAAAGGPAAWLHGGAA